MHLQLRHGPSRTRDAIEHASGASSETRLRSSESRLDDELFDDPNLRLIDAILAQDQLDEGEPDDE